MTFNCVSFNLNWDDAILCLGGILRVDLTIPIVAFCSQVSSESAEIYHPFACSNSFPYPSACDRENYLPGYQFQTVFLCLVACGI